MVQRELFEIIDNVLIKYLGDEETVEIPFGIKVIGQNAFYNSNVKSVVIPNSVTTIAANAFMQCKQLEKIDIPDSIEDIGEGAFAYCTNLVGFKIPSKITHIKKKTFYWCTKLDISIPEGITYIGETAFCMTQTSEITLSKSVKELGRGAFDLCACRKVEILGDILSFSDRVFRGCNNLGEFVVPNDHPRFQTIDGNLYTKDGKKLICYAPGKKEETFIVPNGVEVIGDFSCFESSFKNVVFSGSVKVIGKHAFGDSCIKNLTIPANVKTIQDSAFSNCYTETVDIQDGVEYIGGDGAIFGDFEKIVFPKSIKKIDAHGVITRKQYCVVDLSQINEQAEIDPSFIVRVNPKPFGGSDNAIHCILVNKTLNCNFKVGRGIYIDVEPQNLTPRDIAAISSFPLDVLPTAHRRVAILDFAKGYFIGTKYTANFKKERIQYIAEHYNEWFEDALENPILMAYFVDKKLLTVDQAKAMLNTKIKHEEIIELLLSYIKSKQSKPFKKYKEGFGGIPEDTTRINCGAFAGCQDITDLIVPDCVVGIGSFAFYKAYSLKSISLGKILKYIGEKAFVDCIHLEMIYFNGTIEEWNKIYKGESWFYSWDTEIKVVCTDGEIKIEHLKIEHQGSISEYDLLNSKTFMNFT